MSNIDVGKIKEIIKENRKAGLPIEPASTVPIVELIENYNLIIRKLTGKETSDKDIPIINRISAGRIPTFILTPAKPIGLGGNYMGSASIGQEDQDLVWDASPQLYQTGYIKFCSWQAYPIGNSLYFHFQTIPEKIYSYEIYLFNEDGSGEWQTHRLYLSYERIYGPLIVERVQGAQIVTNSFRASLDTTCLNFFWVRISNDEPLASKSYFLKLVLKRLT